MPNIEIKDVNLGGLSDSKYQGIANSVATLVGLDIHSEPGVIKVNQALTKSSGSTVDDDISAIVCSSNGHTYFFGRNLGKIYKRSSSGVWSSLGTVTPAAGAVGILDAKEYGGRIYFATQSRIGYLDAADVIVNNFATFTNTDAEYHPMVVKNLILYIGDKNYVAQIENTTFTADALDLESQYRISSLATFGYVLVIGTFVKDTVNDVKIFTWNDWSRSFSTEDVVKQPGIFCFLNEDNYVIAYIGTKGYFHQFDGNRLIPYKRLPGDWLGTNKMDIKLNATAYFQGRSMFGVSNNSGNPCLQGVYSIGSYASNYPNVAALEYIISTGNTSNIVIGAMEASGDTLYVAWRDANSGTSYGVDIIDTSNKAPVAYMETRVITGDRLIGKQVAVEVPYRTLSYEDSDLLLETGDGLLLETGDGLLQESSVVQSIAIAVAQDHGAMTTVSGTLVDAIHMVVRTDGAVVKDAKAIQVRVTLASTGGNTAAEIEGVIIKTD